MMIITFCGHGQVNFTDEERERLSNVLEGEIIKNPACTFYLGAYGEFDRLCFYTLKKLKEKYKDIELIFVTPYLDKNYYKSEYAKNHYDGIIFPPLESVPKKIAIRKRNEWMVEKCNLVIAFVRHPWGGAARTFEYAKHKKKPFVNIAETL